MSSIGSPPDVAATDSDLWRARAKRLAEQKLNIPELFGAKETSACLGVNVANLQFIADLPEHVQEVAATRLWLADEIRAFAELFNERRKTRRKGRSSAPKGRKPRIVRDAPSA